jgi:hypothetical protein
VIPNDGLFDWPAFGGSIALETDKNWPGFDLKPSPQTSLTLNWDGKAAKKAIIAVLRKLIVLANALLSKRKLWTPKPA